MPKPLETKNLDLNVISRLFESANKFKLSGYYNTKQNSAIGFCFFENSTRTKLSFELAAKRLGLITIDLNPDTSSLAKGESLTDTLITLQAMGLKAIIVRSGDNDFIAKHQPFLNIPLISAGQGTTDHPTQGLLDAFTIDSIFNSDTKEESKKRVTLIGDIKHSRVSASDLEIFKMLDYNVGVFAPDLLHRSFYNDNVKVFGSKQEMLSETDFLISLRIQKERLHTSGLTDNEAIEIMKDYSIGLTDLKNNQDIYIMHPGPVNWGIELSEDIKNYTRSLINTQVENGVYLRMAVLDMILNERF